MFRSLWQYRHFIVSSIRGDLKGRFVRSRLGGLWFILHPLAQAAIFSIVLSELFKARLPDTDSPAAYPIYLLSGLAAWTLFSEILTRSMTVFIEQAPVMKKIAFPRLCLPIIVGGTALINHLLLLLALFIIFIFLGHLPGRALVLLPLGIVLIAAIGFGLGVILGVMNVFIRDIAQVMTIVLNLWYWLTPVVYPANVLSEKYKLVLSLNPITPLVAIYQDALLFNRWPNPESLIMPAILGIISMSFAIVFFRRASPELIDVL
ncbi:MULTISPECIES: ABC transporter permease [unclassified Mesorhizobium]|uniref:ABC transporter permease n=1 Tax=unclassified Mesorhizobium TaxID=325217 RepID=UPI0003CE273E|nr:MULTISPECIES: ABC transporter permease [unclassified Mesorhizobium]ESX10606.1 Wzm [Mesorhizobium sp. LSJC264A00]ESX91192.1 Wzm [Mesorhizobium sp. LSHC412B00]